MNQIAREEVYAFAQDIIGVAAVGIEERRQAAARIDEPSYLAGFVDCFAMMGEWHRVRTEIPIPVEEWPFGLTPETCADVYLDKERGRVVWMLEAL